MKKLRILLFWSLFLLLISEPISTVLASNPASSNFGIEEYSFGSGGTIGSNSSSFSLYGISGEVEQGTNASGNFQLEGGLTNLIEANLPSAPTLTNPSSTYDRLKIVIDNGNNPSDTTFAIAISSDNFVTIQYVKSDYTIGSTLTNADWLPYSGIGSWGGSTGVYITGLQANTTYKVKVKARKGSFTESPYSAVASATTDVPSLSFGVSPTSVIFTNLNGSNSYTDTTQTTDLTTSTNAYNGYSVYAHETGPLTYLSNTIPDFTAGSASNASPQTWSGIGFGYTTNDTDLAGGTANRFSGPKYAPFTTSAPGDPVADHTGPIITTPINNETFTISYRVTAASTTPAGKYLTNIEYIVVPQY